MASTDISKATTHGTSIQANEEPYIYETTRILSSYYVLEDQLYLYIIALLSTA